MGKKLDKIITEQAKQGNFLIPTMNKILSIACPKCNSVMITNMGSSGTDNVNHYCNSCKYEWED